MEWALVGTSDADIGRVSTAFAFDPACWAVSQDLGECVYVCVL